ncbi:MAG: VOC family protein [Deltaproteobacteria bacterium]|nr:VOC family protein [Deltaproteobacteria bacterium]
MALAKKIDHLAIAVSDLEAAVKTYSTNFGFPVARRQELPALGVHCALLQIGDAQLELFSPATAHSPAGKFIADQGEGLYVLALEVEDLDQARQLLAAKGIAVTPPAALGTDVRLAYVSPEATHGVRLQLIEYKK